MNQEDLQPLSFEILDGGKSLEQLNEALTRMCKDVLHRDKLGKDRCVTLKVFVKPGWDDFLDTSVPEIRCEISEKVPGVTGGIVRGMVSNDGTQILINPKERSAPAQMSLPEGVEKVEFSNKEAAAD